jgi:hypothetical protein
MSYTQAVSFSFETNRYPLLKKKLAGLAAGKILHKVFIFS